MGLLDWMGCLGIKLIGLGRLLAASTCCVSGSRFQKRDLGKCSGFCLSLKLSKMLSYRLRRDMNLRWKHNWQSINHAQCSRQSSKHKTNHKKSKLQWNLPYLNHSDLSINLSYRAWNYRFNVPPTALSALNPLRVKIVPSVKKAA